MNTVSNDFCYQSYHKQFTINCVHSVYHTCKIQMTYMVAKVNCLGCQSSAWCKADFFLAGFLENL